MLTFMTDNIQFSYILIFFFFSSIVRRVFVTFPAYVWTWSNEDYKKSSSQRVKPLNIVLKGALQFPRLD